MGVNGLLLDGKTLYIASYPADGNTTTENVIYKIADITKPVIEILSTRQEQYDGLAFKDNKLFLTIGWAPK